MTYLTKRSSSKITAFIHPKERVERLSVNRRDTHCTPVKLSKPRYQLAQFRIEYPKEVLATLHSDPEGSINSFVTNIEDGEIIIDFKKDVIKTPPRPSEAEKAAGGGTREMTLLTTAQKVPLAVTKVWQPNGTGNHQLEKKPKSFQQKASSDREFETPTPKLWKRSSRVVKADDNTRGRKDIKKNEIVVLQNETDTEDEVEKGLKKRGMSPEEKEEITEEYYKRQKLKEKEDTPQGSVHVWGQHCMRKITQKNTCA
ncbi:hypothetical protein JTB14_017012 [Gonioctena quinquepunctata]|nr:hypothetical protein JTB14_017012 [Gonioctena quinquepunctata]